MYIVCVMCVFGTMLTAAALLHWFKIGTYHTVSCFSIYVANLRIIAFTGGGMGCLVRASLLLSVSSRKELTIHNL